MDVTELLAHIKQQLSASPAALEYLQPMRAVHYYEYLTADPGRKQGVFHFYYSFILANGYPVGETNSQASVILHGHEDNEGCAAPYFCHELGYRPSGSEHPAFIKNFNKKWNLT